MQGRQRREEEPWDKYASQRLEALSNTSKHRVVPQRPTNMAHVNEPPKAPRVGRLKVQAAPPPALRQRLMFWGCGLVVFAILVAFGSYIGFNLYNATTSSSGAAVSVVNFLGAVKNTNYAQAYTYLGPAITLHLSPEQFSNQAKNDDSCFGVITDYKLVENSTVYKDSDQSYEYSYTIMRAKLKQPYQLQLTLQQDLNAQNAWKITSYGNDLGSSGHTINSCQP